MRDLAKASVEGVTVGATGIIRPDSRLGETLESFQAVELEADRLSAAGVISITLKHRENMSGKKQIDWIQFVRMK